MPCESSVPRASPSTNERKYQTQNPVVRWLVQRFLCRISAYVHAEMPSEVVDLGCGEGEVAAFLQSKGLLKGYLGIDSSGAAVQKAMRRCPGLRFRQGDIGDAAAEDEAADLVLCLEVLEHLSDPARAVAMLHARSRKAVLVSVPWEPYFRLGNLAQGKHIPRLGNHPEHVQSFAPDSLHALLASSFATVHVESCFPWLIGLARK